MKSIFIVAINHIDDINPCIFEFPTQEKAEEFINEIKNRKETLGYSKGEIIL